MYVYIHIYHRPYGGFQVRQKDSDDHEMLACCKIRARVEFACACMWVRERVSECVGLCVCVCECVCVACVGKAKDHESVRTRQMTKKRTNFVKEIDTLYDEEIGKACCTKKMVIRTRH